MDTVLSLGNTPVATVTQVLAVSITTNGSPLYLQVFSISGMTGTNEIIIELDDTYTVTSSMFDTSYDIELDIDSAAYDVPGTSVTARWRNASSSAKSTRMTLIMQGV